MAPHRVGTLAEDAGWSARSWRFPRQGTTSSRGRDTQEDTSADRRRSDEPTRGRHEKKRGNGSQAVTRWIKHGDREHGTKEDEGLLILDDLWRYPTTRQQSMKRRSDGQHLLQTEVKRRTEQRNEKSDMAGKRPNKDAEPGRATARSPRQRERDYRMGPDDEAVLSLLKDHVRCKEVRQCAHSGQQERRSTQFGPAAAGSNRTHVRRRATADRPDMAS